MVKIEKIDDELIQEAYKINYDELIPIIIENRIYFKHVDLENKKAVYVIAGDLKEFKEKVSKLSE